MGSLERELHSLAEELNRKCEVGFVDELSMN